MHGLKYAMEYLGVVRWVVVDSGADRPTSVGAELRSGLVQGLVGPPRSRGAQQEAELRHEGQQGQAQHLREGRRLARCGFNLPSAAI